MGHWMTDVNGDDYYVEDKGHWMTDVNGDDYYVGGKIEKFASSRRPALLMIRHFRAEDNIDLLCSPYLWRVIDQVPVFVWPNPTLNGDFIVEFEDGRCETVPPYNLKFLDSEKEFNQYNWDNYRHKENGE